MKLIKEEVLETKVVIEEAASGGDKNYFIEGVFMRADYKNKNGRMYKFDTLKKAADSYDREYISKNRAFGELGHPDTPSINLDRVSHMITNLYPDGSNFIGKAKIVNTPMGNIVKGLLDSGASLGVSTRGVGSLKPFNGYQLVQDDFQLAAAADIVANPSADCFVDPILESVEWIFENGRWTAQEHEEAQRQIRKASRKEVEAVALKLFESYISKL